MALTSEELLAECALTHEVDIPRDLLHLNGSGEGVDCKVVLRPLNVLDLQRIDKAAREDESLSATLMIQEALVQPALTAEQIFKLPAGLAQFLVERINSISGISTPRDALFELPAKADHQLLSSLTEVGPYGPGKLRQFQTTVGRRRPSPTGIR